MGAPPKYEEKSSALSVALINISLSSGRRGRRSFRTISRKSSFMPRSWISSTITWVTPFKLLSRSNLRNRTPVVQKRRRVSLPFIPSNRTLYPTDSPIFSPLSAATLSETAIADIRLG
uniref:Uncharacterized protein n=1 Tax=Arundo donax TaxID=35708 RepID=A0A0A9GHH7_ARUDO